MKKRIICFLTLLFMLLPQLAQANELHSITIVKYKLEGGNELNRSMVHDGTKVDQVTDQNGQTLEVLSGIEYVIVRVKKDGDGYIPTTGTEAFSTEITTNSEGIAHVGGLPKGFYQVFEKKQEPLLSNPMEPVVVELPMLKAGGEGLKDVYLYPKSNVVIPSPGGPVAPGSEDPKIGGSSEAGKPKPATKLPQTAGNIGSIYYLIGLMGLTLIIGIIGMMMGRKEL